MLDNLCMGAYVARESLPGISWTHDDVRREYKKLAVRIGMPKYVVTDGASELRESVDVLKNKGKRPSCCET